MVQTLHKVLKASGQVSASGNTETDYVDVRSANQYGIFYLSVTAKEGTNPTLDVSVVTWDETSNSWFTLTSFTQATTSTTEMKTSAYIGQRLAIVYTIGGTNTPKFTFSVSADLKE